MRAAHQKRSYHPNMVASDLVAAVGAVPVRGCLRNLLVQGCGRSALSLFEGWRLEATVQRSDCQFSALRGFSRSWPQEESRPPKSTSLGSGLYTTMLQMHI